MLYIWTVTLCKVVLKKATYLCIIIVFIINTFTGNDQIIVIPCKCIDFTELETANGIETMYKIL